MLKISKSQLKLQDCLTKYLSLRRSSSLSYFYRKEVERVFSQFCQFIEKTYIEDITFSDLQEYNQEIYRLAENCPTRPDLFILKRFTGLRAIFKAIVKKEENKEPLLKLIANLQVLDYPRKKKTQPTCITKEQFQNIYQNYSGLTRLMLTCPN